MPASSLTVIGLMAGTSVDGIDASLVETDGEQLIPSSHAITLPYRDEARSLIFAAMDSFTARGPEPDRRQLDAMIAEDHAAVVETLIDLAGRKPDLIGFHGQTIFHDPAQGVTLQAGDAAYLRQRLGIPVAHDFRQADIAAGGEGAPIAPVYHRSLMAEMRLPLPAAIANIGGITNLSLWDGATLHGFDTGPGNALMDHLARMTHDQEYDRNGAIAGTGKADEAAVAEALRHPYFSRTGPRSLDRGEVLEMGACINLNSSANMMASFAALTAESLAQSTRAAGVQHLVLCGGGARNPVLVEMIRKRAAIPVTTMEDHGREGDFIEAELMAFLAVRCRRGLPITFPGTTGVKAPLAGGRIIE